MLPVTDRLPPEAPATSAEPITPAPLLSVGMPVYNGARWIAEAIESILGQSFTDLELIVSDNASTDDTRAICEAFARRDRRVRYSRRAHNTGAFANYNFVYRQCRGRYFKWASANDLCAEDFLANCVQALESNPRAVLAYPKTRLFETDPASATDYEERFDLSVASRRQRFVALLKRIRLNNILNGVIRTETLRQVPEQGTFVGSDTNLLGELVLHGPFIEVPSAVLYRRMLPEACGRILDEREFHRVFAPALDPDFPWLYWRRHYEFFAAVRRSPATLVEKLALFAFLGHRAWWDLPVLTRECWSFCTRKLARAPRGLFS